MHKVRFCFYHGLNWMLSKTDLDMAYGSHMNALEKGTSSFGMVVVAMRAGCCGGCGLLCVRLSPQDECRPQAASNDSSRVAHGANSSKTLAIFSVWLEGQVCLFIGRSP